jgi:predicted XRE-type DNA-binding protein
MTTEFIPYEQALALRELGLKKPRVSPLYQQAFRFFREKYNLISYIHPLALLQDTKKWCYEITNFESSWDEDIDLHSPEEAELACLIKLIEIVKKK